MTKEFFGIDYAQEARLIYGANFYDDYPPTGKNVELTVDVDEALIGGLRTEIGGRLFDGSVKTQLKRIEDTLTKG